MRQRERTRSAHKRRDALAFRDKDPRGVAGGQPKACTWLVHVRVCTYFVAVCQIELNSRKLDSRLGDSGY